MLSKVALGSAHAESFRSTGGLCRKSRCSQDVYVDFLFATSPVMDGIARRLPSITCVELIGVSASQLISDCPSAGSCATMASMPSIALAMMPLVAAPFPRPPPAPISRAQNDADPGEEEDYSNQCSSSSLTALLPHALSLASLVFLVPGLTSTLFSATAEVNLFGITVPILQISKSTLGSVSHLFSEEHYLPAALIFAFSVAIPVVKATVIGTSMILGKRSSNTTEERDERNVVPSTQAVLLSQPMWLVRRMAKWAHVDAICAATLAAGLEGGPDAILTVGLQSGFYYFVGYCGLSTCAAIVGSEDITRSKATTFETPRTPTGEVNVNSVLLDAFKVIGAVVGGVAIVTHVVTMPMLSFKMVDMGFGSDQFLSLLDCVKRSFDNGEPLVGGYLGLTLFYLPAADLACAFLRLSGSTSSLSAVSAHHPLTRALSDFALLDVCLASLVVTKLATNGLSHALDVTLAPEGIAVLVAYVSLRYALEYFRHEQAAIAAPVEARARVRFALPAEAS